MIARSTRLAFALSTTLFALTASAADPAAPVGILDGVFTGANGMSLYVFDKDTAGSGKSACNGPCQSNWPPMAAKADDKPVGDFTVVTRDDGSKQWAYRGKPLYFWAKDQKPGDRSGDGVNGTWHLAKP